MQVVKIPVLLERFGFNFKCEACGCEFHLNKLGYLGDTEASLIDVNAPGNEKVIKCPNWHCGAKIKLVTVEEVEVK